MPSQSVLLTSYQQSMVASLVGSGRYADADEVLREGLRLLEAREARDAARLQALREAASIGFDDLDQGRYEDLDTEDLRDWLSHLDERADGEGNMASQ